MSAEKWGDDDAWCLRRRQIENSATVVSTIHQGTDEGTNARQQHRSAHFR